MKPLLQKWFFFSLMLVLMNHCASDADEPHQTNDFQIIPQPRHLAPGLGYFQLTVNTPIQATSTTDGPDLAVQYLQAWLQEQGHQTSSAEGGPEIQLKRNDNLAPEAYVLTITQKGILVQGGSDAGTFYGVQSLIQLIQQQDSGTWPVELPCVHIEDQPEFAYRGFHLDVGRHFFPVDFIKKYIDLLAQYKMNRFHWHLTEDQGWRIEIKKYPRLQEVAAFRKETLVGHYNDYPAQYDGQRYGGYYTQDEVREIVQYAQERFVTVIPEIEMPGHAQAALAAYPELSCTGEPTEVKEEWGVSSEVYCPSETTFRFLEDVLTEVMDLFPSEYIHIGGDECPKTSWEQSAFCQDLIRKEKLGDEHGLQSYFIRRIEQFLNDHGRQIIGWDEILEGGLAPNATVMSWRGETGGIEAARQGHDVVMSPTSHCYLDYYQTQHPDEPLAIGGFLPLEKVYSYHPVPEELSEAEARHILGVQGNLWTEYIKTPEQVEYMAFPRMIALAEVGWTPSSRKDLKQFTQRLESHLNRLKKAGVNTANPLYDLSTKVTQQPEGEWQLTFTNLIGAGQIYYTIDGSTPSPASLPYRGTVSLDQSGQYTGQAFQDGKAVGRPAQINYQQHLATTGQLTLQQQPSPVYNAGGNTAIINGILGSNDKYGDKEWLGFSGDDFTARLDLKAPKSLQRIQFRFFNAPGQWIYPPKSVELQLRASPDGPAEKIRTEVTGDQAKVIEVTLDLRGISAQYLDINIPNFGIIPAGRQGAGQAAWLFIDEIILH